MSRASAFRAVAGTLALAGLAACGPAASNNHAADAAANQAAAAVNEEAALANSEAPPLPSQARSDIPSAGAPPVLPRGTNWLYRLSGPTIECGRADSVGFARALFVAAPGGAVTDQVMTNGQCLPIDPSMAGAKQLRIQHFEDVPWRGSPDNQHWWSGVIRVAEERATMDGQTVVGFVPAQDLAPIAPTEAPSTPQAAPPASAAGPSFDCSRVSSHTLTIVCTTPGLAAEDAEMARLYSRLVALAPADLAQIRSDQRRFVREDRAACDNAPCLAAAYGQRIAQLRALLEANGQAGAETP